MIHVNLSRLRCSQSRLRYSNPISRLWVEGPKGRLISPKTKSTSPWLTDWKNHSHVIEWCAATKMMIYWSRYNWSFTQWFSNQHTTRIGKQGFANTNFMTKKTTERPRPRLWKTSFETSQDQDSSLENHNCVYVCTEHKPLVLPALKHPPLSCKLIAPCGLGSCRISPPRFLAECGRSPLNQGSFVVLYFVWFHFFWVVISYCSLSSVILICLLSIVWRSYTTWMTLYSLECADVSLRNYSPPMQIINKTSIS